MTSPYLVGSVRLGIGCFHLEARLIEVGGFISDFDRREGADARVRLNVAWNRLLAQSSVAIGASTALRNSSSGPSGQPLGCSLDVAVEEVDLRSQHFGEACAAFVDIVVAAGAAEQFPDWLALLLDREMTYRQDRKLTARLRYARLRHQAAVEDVDYRITRGLDRALFQKLAEGSWIDAHDNVILCGPTEPAS
jgi:hypothetical protein